MTTKYSNPAFDNLSKAFLNNDIKKTDTESEPLPLRRILSDEKSFPIDALGSTLGPAARRIFETIKAPMALCGQSVLAASSLAVQGHLDVKIDGRVMPISNFFLTVGESGERKSAVDNIVNIPAKEKEIKLIKDYQTSNSFYKNDIEIYKALKDKLLKGNKEVFEKESIHESFEELGEAPLEPLLPNIITDDSTFEGLTKNLFKGQPSMGIFSSEGGRLFGGYSFGQDQQLKTAGGLSNFWDGVPTTILRSGEGAITIKGKRVSIHAMFQPIVLNPVLSNEILVGQGFLSRCLISYPTSTIGSRSYNESNLLEDNDILKFHKKLSTLFDVDLPLHENSRNELNPNIVELDPKAKRKWILFYNDLEKKLPNKYSAIKGFGAKIPEQALRLAGCLAGVENIESRKINTNILECGIELANYYLEEMLRLSSEAIVDPKVLLAEKLLFWLQSQPTKVFHLAQVYQQGPNQLRESKKAKEIISVLEEHNWLIKQPAMTLEGSKRKDVWVVRHT